MDRRRRSVRLSGHDYRAGLYAVTICAAGRRPAFGSAADGVVMLSATGEIVRNEWIRTGEVRPDVVLDAFVVMPNHVHLLFGIVGDTEPSPDVGRGVLQYALRASVGGSSRHRGQSEP